MNEEPRVLTALRVSAEDIEVGDLIDYRDVGVFENVTELYIFGNHVVIHTENNLYDARTGTIFNVIRELKEDSELEVGEK